LVDDAKGLVSSRSGGAGGPPLGIDGKRPGKADRLVFDLDPARDVPWEGPCSAARRVKERLEGSGAWRASSRPRAERPPRRGPRLRTWGWARSRLSQGMAAAMEEAHPGEYVSKATKTLRPRKDLHRLLRKRPGRDVRVPLLTRDKAGAPVSTPVRWESWGGGARPLRTLVRPCAAFQAQKGPLGRVLELSKNLPARCANPWRRSTRGAMKTDDIDSSGERVSFWTDTERRRTFKPLSDDRLAGRLRVGGGITGLTTAYLLIGKAKSVVLRRTGRSAARQTGRPPATCQRLDDRYERRWRSGSGPAARAAAESHTAAIDLIDRSPPRERHRMRFQRLDGYLFALRGDLRACWRTSSRAASHGRARRAYRMCADPRAFACLRHGPLLRFPAPGSVPRDEIPVRPGRRSAERRRAHLYRYARDGGGRRPLGPRRGERRVDRLLQGRRGATNVPVNDLVTLHAKQGAYRT